MKVSVEYSQYYGRRSARRLTRQRVDALMKTLARYEVKLPEDGGKLAIIDPIWLEIGFGSGEHLLELVKRNPDRPFIGCEPFLNGVAALLRELQVHEIGNVAIFPEDARMLLKALPDASVERAYVLFADPWPKLRHNRRRMINPDTLDDFARVLTADGEFYLATDHADLARWYLEVIDAHPCFCLRPAGGDDAQTRPPDWPATRYEIKAVAAQRKPFYFCVSRADGGAGLR